MILALWIIIALFAGIIAGCITGLLPGIHINLVAAFLISLPFAFVSVLIPVVFIAAMTITHTFLDFIPSIFLGAPDEDSFLSVLPGHELLLEGRGHEALILTLYGGIIGLALILVFTPVFIFVFPKIYFYLKFVMFFVLVFANLYLIFSGEEKTLALIVFLLSGFLGLSTLILPVKETLLPLLSGLFGASSLITSIIKKQKIPKQKITRLKDIKIDKRQIGKISLASVLAGPLCAFLPALGTGQAAIIGSNIVKVDRKEFLVLLGAINTIIAGLSFVTLYSINKARTGTAAAIQNLLPGFSSSDLLVILGVLLVAGILAFIIAILLSRVFARIFSKINYIWLSIFILLFLAAVVLVFSGWLGFLLFVIASFVGLFAVLSGARRTNLMGSLMLPAIILYWPF